MSIMCHLRRWKIFTFGLAAGVGLLAACSDSPRHYTIGVVNYVPALETVLQGFKARMAELGYLDGRQITYVYRGVLDPGSNAIEREVGAFKKQRVDLVLALGMRPAKAAKEVLGTDIPVVFAPVINPVEEGLIERLTRPGGSMTGVQNTDSLAKSLEWLHRAVPHAKQIHVIYHANDQVARTTVKSLQAAASAIGIEVDSIAATSRDAALALIERLPKGAALLFPISPGLYPLEPMIESATRNGVAVATNSPSHLRGSWLLFYGADFDSMGRQAAVLAVQIFNGAKPAELPVAKAEYSLRINLQTARRIGVDIQDSLLDQATLVIR
jgi:putative ABC transport system substrate-binding protein